MLIVTAYQMNAIRCIGLHVRCMRKYTNIIHFTVLVYCNVQYSETIVK